MFSLLSLSAFKYRIPKRINYKNTFSALSLSLFSTFAHSCLSITIEYCFPDDIIPVGSIGLAVSQSMVLTFLLQMAARLTADFLAQMTAVERVLEYTRLPAENNMDHGSKIRNG